MPSYEGEKKDERMRSVGTRKDLQALLLCSFERATLVYLVLWRIQEPGETDDVGENHWGSKVLCRVSGDPGHTEGFSICQV